MGEDLKNRIAQTDPKSLGPDEAIYLQHIFSQRDSYAKEKMTEIQKNNIDKLLTLLQMLFNSYELWKGYISYTKEEQNKLKEKEQLAEEKTRNGKKIESIDERIKNISVLNMAVSQLLEKVNFCLLVTKNFKD